MAETKLFFFGRITLSAGFDKINPTEKCTPEQSVYLHVCELLYLWKPCVL